MKTTINIILGLKNNDSCLSMVKYFEDYLEQNFDENFQLGTITHTFSRSELDSAIASGLYQACFVLEKMENQPIGQGAIKAWRKACPSIRIILLMGAERRSTAKANGLYEIGYYEGMFLEQKMQMDVLARLFEYGRSKEDAFTYYGLESFIPFEKKPKEPIVIEEPAEEIVKETVEENTTTTEDSSENLNFPQEEDEPASEEETFEHEEVPLASEPESQNDIAPEEDTAAIADIIEPLEEVTEEINSPAENDDISKSEIDESENITEEAEPSEDDAPKERVFSNGTGNSNKKNKVGKIDFIKQTNVAQKPIAKILGSDSEAQSYFENISKNVYKTNEKEERGSFDAAEDVFIATLERYMDQFEVVLDDAAIGVMQSEELEDHVFEIVNSINADANIKAIANERFLRFVRGYDFLEELLLNPDVTDVHVLDESHIRVKKKDERMSTNLRFYGTHRYERLCKQILLRNRERLNTSGITSSFTDASFSEDFYLQVTVVDATINSSHKPELLIRKTPKAKYRMDYLISEGYLSVREASYLIHEIVDGSSVLVSGGSASGKTTLLNALIDYIPKSRCGTIIQYRDELLPGAHPEMIVQHPLAERKIVDSKGVTSVIDEVPLEQLAEDALSKDVDYYVLGDIKGKEASSFYKAIMTGHTGLACVTALTPRESLTKVISNIAGFNIELRHDIRQSLSERIQTIVVMDKWKVTSIYRVLGCDENGEVIYESLFD